jgi:hypothetical protein
MSRLRLLRLIVRAAVAVMSRDYCCEAFHVVALVVLLEEVLEVEVMIVSCLYYLNPSSSSSISSSSFSDHHHQNQRQQQSASVEDGNNALS